MNGRRWVHRIDTNWPKKVLDAIDHQILLSKLEKTGLPASATCWIQSYLTECSPFVEIEGERSFERDIIYGVPQGSILGPLLFVLYIRDISQGVSCEILLYADDSCLTVIHKNLKYIEYTLNTNLSSLCELPTDNKLSIHLGKTFDLL